MKSNNVLLFFFSILLLGGEFINAQTTFRGFVVHAIRVDDGCDYQEPDPPFVDWSASFLRDAVVRVNTFPTMARCTSPNPYIGLGEACATTSADFPIAPGANWECTVDDPQNIVQLLCSVPGNSTGDWQNGVGWDDLSILSLYVNGQQIEFLNPFLKIAADVNGDGTIDAGDFAPMVAIIMGDASNIPSGSPWRIMSSYLINSGNQSSGFNEVFCEDPLSSAIDYPNYLSGRTECGWYGVPRGGWPGIVTFNDVFLAIKRGDLNFNTDGLAPDDPSSKRLAQPGLEWEVRFDEVNTALSLEIEFDKVGKNEAFLHGFIVRNKKASGKILPLADSRLSKDQMPIDNEIQLHWLNSTEGSNESLTFRMDLPSTNPSELLDAIARWKSEFEIIPLYRDMERERDLVEAGFIRYSDSEFGANMLGKKADLLVRAFPNPSIDQTVTLDIQLSDIGTDAPADAEVTFFTLDGKTIQTQKIGLAGLNHREQFLLPADHKGLILWQVKTANSTATGKLVVQ